MAAFIVAWDSITWGDRNQKSANSTSFFIEIQFAPNFQETTDLATNNISTRLNFQGNNANRVQVHPKKQALSPG